MVAPYRFSVAPMMDLTDRHARYLLRLISRHALLYTEMVTADALLFGDSQKLLRYNVEEHPLALQLGGSDPDKLARCCAMAQDRGYDEVNLNVGCPSDRVQAGRFGACLMLEPDLVARCHEAMSKACTLPITIKCRIGVDEQQPEQCLPAFVDAVQAAGCQSLAIHARKAWLKGLSPKENREIPPLDYDLVYRIKQQFPAMTVVINGGITSLDEVQQHLLQVDGVMMGRKAYFEPYLLHEVDALVFGEQREPPSRHEVFLRYLDYVARELENGTPLKHLGKPLLGLFHGRYGARHFRRTISEEARLDGAGIEVLHRAATYLSDSGEAAGSSVQ